MRADRMRWGWERCSSLRRHARAASEQEEEFRFHLAMETEANLGKGMSPEEARRQARRAFGGADWHAERTREARGGVVWEDLVRDLRFGFRNLRKRPVFALTAVVTLALGIGMTSTMFTLVDAVILSPLPGSDTRGLVYLGLESEDGRIETSPTPQLLRLLRDHASSFSRVEAYTAEDLDLRVGGEPLRVRGARASVGFFSFLGVRPILGRGFLPEDGRGTHTPVALLTDTFWRQRFGGDRNAVGRTLDVGGVTHQIVGVLPRDFAVDAPRPPLIWLPEGAAGALLDQGAPVEGALARLADGVSLEVAQAELHAMVRNNPLDRRGGIEWVGRIRRPRDLVDPSLTQALLVFQMASVLVLLIGCGNLTNLLLAQGETRGRELALRASLGAGRGRLIRQLLVESLLLGALGGAGGLLLARWALDASPLLLPPEMGGALLNGRVVLFAAGVSLLSVLGAGLLPALRGSRKELGETIKGHPGNTGGGRAPTWGRQALVAAEVAMAFVLLTSAGLLLKSFSELMASDVGFDSRDLLAVRLELPEERYPDPQAQLAFLQRLRGEVQEGFPETLGPVTVASGLVEDLAAAVGPLVPEGAVEREEEPTIFIAWKVAPEYFDVVGVPILRGRGFDEGDGWEGEEVVVLGAAVAERYFPGVDPVGRQLEIRGKVYRVVGVTGSLTLPSLARGQIGELQVFFPLAQRAGDKLSLLARVPGDRSAAVDLLKGIVWAIDPALPVVDVALVEDALAESVARERSNALLMVVFALTALVLGAVGIYGVVAYSVSRRTREVGIRMALGASPGRVLRRMVLGGMTSVGMGIALGGGGAVVLGKALSSLLFRVSPRDPSVFLLVFLTIAVVAVLATWVPARRASGSGPLEALKAD